MIREKASVEVKQTVTRVTIEGEHTCMIVIRKSESDEMKKESVDIELIPILNAPHQFQSIAFGAKDIKLCLTYRYLFQRTALRIVTH